MPDDIQPDDIKPDSTTRRHLLQLGALGVIGAAMPWSPVRGASQSVRPSPAPTMPFATATEAAAAVKSGKVSSVELTELAFERIARLDGPLNSVVVVLRDSALAEARAADAARAGGKSLGPLQGVPVLIKESFAIRGVPTTVGLPEMRDYRPTEDAVAVQRLRDAGAVILGKTNIPTMLDDVQSDNPIYGRSSNPWDLARGPGGSSGGSAAALAAGLGWLATGSDIGGSIRTPASFCGVYGHKPTLDVVPEDGHLPPLPQDMPWPSTMLAVCGPMARSAEDLRLAMEILGGPTGDAARALRWTLPAPRRASLRDYRVGFVLDDPRCPVVPEVTAVLQRTVDALSKAGVVLREGWPEGIDPRRDYDNYLYLLIAETTPVTAAQVSAVRQDVAAPGIPGVFARAVSDSHWGYLESRAAVLRAQAAWRRYFADYDVFLSPVDFVPAFPHQVKPPDLFLGADNDPRRIATLDGPREYLDILFWIHQATLTGLPATSAPAGLTAQGLPVGVQVMGPMFEDATPIDFAAKLAQLVGGFSAPPGYA